MKIRRIISMFLAVLFMISMCAVTVGAADTSTGTTNLAAEEEVAEKVNYTYYTSSVPDPADAKTQYFKDSDLGWTEPTVFDSPEEKLTKMDLRLQKDGYQIYIDEYSGEVACKNLTTGEILFTNPYNIGTSVAKGDVMYELMSQILVEYTDKSTGITKTFASFEETSLRGQIRVKNIKNGLRVEYTIGREEAKMLVPRLIEKTRFETKIRDVLAKALAPDGEIGELRYKKVIEYYRLYDASILTTDAAIESLYAELPITKKMAVYSIDDATKEVEFAKIEMFIKNYAPSYTYEDLDYDHELTEYEGEEQSPPLFKMALEYTLDTDGLSVTLPANGLRFDESRYTLENITVLPFMGAGMSPNEGYTFFPDGSGALFDFEQLRELSETRISGQVYGVDYAYQTITATHQETIRYPVFGIVETQQLTALNPDGSIREYEQDRGFVAIIEEGDSMAELTTYHGGKSTHEYHTVQMTYYPRPKDSYNIKDAISSTSNGGSAMWEVVSSRKYTGNYTIRYVMLTDEDVAEQIQYDMGEDEIFEYYECSYMGMASAYRDQLIANGVLSQLTAEDVKEDIPLYINTFGAIETTEKIMSIPIDVKVALTSFSDVETMYAELAEQGITNVNFKLTGYYNGGMYAEIPYNLNWEDAVGKDDGFKHLLQDAESKGYNIFPDFDFVYVSEDGLFDGLYLYDHVVKSIDNRYTSRREYSATKQAFVSYFELCISPAYFENFYTKLTENYMKFYTEGYDKTISVGTLGSELNSDFDEDDPYNREDAKSYTVKAFQYFDENYDYVMTSAGNAYTWQYVDYILDVPLDSSRFIRASASVPFMGMVLHSYVQFAGTPINMEGNLDYAFLKAIENGASVNFILSYQNTTTLKEDVRLSKYYSIRYDIWFNDVIEIYDELNTLLSDVQLEAITDHEFIEGLRVADLDEVENDLDAAILESIEAEREALDAQALESIETILNARQLIRINNQEISKEIAKLESYNASIKQKLGYTVVDGEVVYTNNNFLSLIKAFNDDVQTFIQLYNGGKCTAKDLNSISSKLGTNGNASAANLFKFFDQDTPNSVNAYAADAYKADLAARTAYENALAAYEILANEPEVSDYIKELAWAMIEDTAESVAIVSSLAPEIYEIAQDAYDYAISGTATLTDSEGNPLCEISAYQFYLFAVSDQLSEIKNWKGIDAKFVLQRYEIGLSSNNLTAVEALDRITNMLQIEVSTDTPDYKTIFDAYLTTTRKGFAGIYEEFVTEWEAYQEVYDKYLDRKATSTDLENALTPLIKAAENLNKEYGYFVNAFSGVKEGDRALYTLYSEEAAANTLGLANAFSEAFATCYTAEAPTEEQLAALANAAADLTASFEVIGDYYAVVPDEYASGINTYAQDAENHLTILRSAMDTAESVWNTLKNKQISEDDEGYADYVKALAAAEETYNNAKAAYEAIEDEANEVIRLANEAYDYAYAMDENQDFLKVLAETMLLAEKNEDIAEFVCGKLTVRLTPYDYIAEDVEEDLEEEEEEYNKYRVDDNSIVLVTYGSGDTETRFLLNYCNYAVTVEIDGITYQVDAQSYQKIPPKQVESEV